MRTLPTLWLLVLVISLSASSGNDYRIVKKIPLPGNGSWDYLTVDDAARRLYVSHGTEVEVLDVDSGAIVGKIPDTLGVHGIAIATEVGRGFTSNGKASTVTIFDLKTLKPLGELKTGKDPDAIIYDPATRRVFAFNGKGDSATVIDDEVKHLVLNHQTCASLLHFAGRFLEDFHCAAGVPQDQARTEPRHRATYYYSVECLRFVHSECKSPRARPRSSTRADGRAIFRTEQEKVKYARS